MVASIAAATVFLLIMSEDEPPVTEINPPEVLEGESVYNNYPIAYPHIQESQIQRITIVNRESYKEFYNENEDEAPKKTSYALVRDEEAGGNFVLLYQDINGNPKRYVPAITEKDVTFDYESLYAKETNDGYGTIYKLTYLCIALELPYFTDRIDLLPAGEARESQLRGFGLDSKNSASIVFDYKNANGELVTRGIRLGEKNVTGYGYYFMVTDEIKDGREITDADFRQYIYNSGADYYNYAMLGFYSYVNGVLVAEGLSEDSSYEPYLTTGYKQWVNNLHKTQGESLAQGSIATLISDIFTPVEARLKKEDYEKDTDRFILDETLKADYESDSSKTTYIDGYITENDSSIEIDLSKPDYKKFVQALKDAKIGSLGNVSVTLTTDSKNIVFENDQPVKYAYEISAIESIVTDGADITAPGTVVGTNNLVRLMYKLKINGVLVSNVPHHGVLDLSTASLDAGTVSAIRAASVGALAAPITLEVNYDTSNAITKNVKYVVDEIIEVYNEYGKAVSVVTEKCQVYYRYYFVVDGNTVMDGDDIDYEIGLVNLADASSETAATLREHFVGKDITKNEEAKKLGIKLFDISSYYEYMQDFMTYSVSELKYFVTSEMVSAFAYWNNSERDSFYGESIYENELSEDNKYKIYAINSDACESVAKVLGGIGSDSTSSSGLVGETVCVGITPEMKDHYGLYAYTVYFELPRGVIVIDSGDGDSVDDYDQYQKLGFTLFISEEKYDEQYDTYYRYVGSDLYDVIAKVDADKLEFLNYGFVEFWARRTLMMFDIKSLEKMSMEFMMDDLKGNYEFFIPHASKSNETFEVRVLDKCLVSGTNVHAADCGCMNTKLSALQKEEGGTFASLSDLYTKHFTPEGEKYYSTLNGKPYQLLYSNVSYDTAGVGYFREFIGGIYSTQFGGVLTEAEQLEAFGNECILKISVTLDQKSSKNTTTDMHAYEFYRLDDRRIMVCQYQYKIEDGNVVVTTQKVSDFYISTLAFKKIVGNAVALLNAESVDQDVAYPGSAKQ